MKGKVALVRIGQVITKNTFECVGGGGGGVFWKEDVVVSCIRKSKGK